MVVDGACACICVAWIRSVFARVKSVRGFFTMLKGLKLMRFRKLHRCNEWVNIIVLFYCFVVQLYATRNGSVAKAGGWRACWTELRCARTSRLVCYHCGAMFVRFTILFVSLNFTWILRYATRTFYSIRLFTSLVNLYLYINKNVNLRLNLRKWRQLTRRSYPLPTELP